MFGLWSRTRSSARANTADNQGGLNEEEDFIILGVLVVMGAIAGGIVYANLDTAIKLSSMAVNYIKYLNAPAGTTVTELAPGYKGAALALSPAAEARLPDGGAGDWPGYNRTLTSERFSQISQINTSNVNTLKVLCTYDTGQYTGFNSGLIKVNDALIFTTQFDIFSIDPATCHQNWRTREDYKPATPQPVSRGAAYMDGQLFRGSGDGRVLAYDFKTGKRVWETRIADAKRGETTPSAPIAWNGLVFIGNAGSDLKGGKGRMYALEAKTGKIVWEFYMVPKTEDDIARGPMGELPLDMSTWKMLRGYPSREAERGRLTRWIPRRAFSTYPWVIPGPISRPTSARAPIYLPVRFSCWTPKPAPTKTISSSCQSTGTTGTCPTRPR